MSQQTFFVVLFGEVIEDNSKKGLMEIQLCQVFRQIQCQQTVYFATFSAEMVGQRSKNDLVVQGEIWCTVFTIILAKTIFKNCLSFYFYCFFWKNNFLSLINDSEVPTVISKFSEKLSRALSIFGKQKCHILFHLANKFPKFNSFNFFLEHLLCLLKRFAKYNFIGSYFAPEDYHWKCRGMFYCIISPFQSSKIKVLVKNSKAHALFP